MVYVMKTVKRWMVRVLLGAGGGYLAATLAKVDERAVIPMCVAGVAFWGLLAWAWDEADCFLPPWRRNAKLPR